MAWIIVLGHLRAVAVNEVATEQTQLQQVAMKDPKKVEAGTWLAEYNCRELAKAQKSEPKLTSSQYYGTGTIVAKKIMKMTPPSIQKFDLEDMGKLVAIVTVSEMMQEYLIKQKILPEHINF